MTPTSSKDYYLSDAYQARKLIDTFPGEYFGAFRDPVRQLVFMGQMFAWAKLSMTNELPPSIKSLFDIRLQQMSPEELVPLSKSFDELSEQRFEAFMGFGERLRHTGFAYFTAIAHEVQQFFRDGKRDFSAVADVLLESAPVREVEGWIPRELASLAVQLLAPGAADSFYCPFTSAWRLASEASKTSKHVAWESERKSQIDAVLSILADNQLELHLSDPITHPSCIENGELKKFDFGAFVSIGRFNKEVPHDSFSRFPEKTNSSDVLAIRHVLAQVTGPAVGIMGHGFLFKTSAGERELKANLIHGGWLKAVISLPAGLLAGTSIPTCLLLLDKRRKSDHILFVDASREQFWETRERKDFGSARIELKNVDELIGVIQERKKTAYSQLVPAKDCEANEYNLVVDRYVLSSENAKLSEVLSSQEVCELVDVVDELIRPQSVKTEGPEGTDHVEFLEVGVADIDDDGFVRKPGKTVPVKGKITRALGQALKPGDILLAMKGSVGAVGFVPETKFDKVWIAGQSFIIIRPKPSVVEPEVLFRLLRSPVCQSYIRSRSTGTTVKMLQMHDIKSLPVPELDAEHRQRIKAAHDELLRLHAESAKLKEQIKQIEQDIWPETGAGGGDE